MLGRTDSRPRLVFLLIVFALLSSALGLRLAYWQIGQADELRTRAEQQIGQPAVEQPQRGEIYDRSGAVLATTAYRDLVAAYPDLIDREDRAPIATRLAEILEFDDAQARSLVETFTQETPPPYTVVARRLTQAQSEQIRAGVESGTLRFVELEPQPYRFYPNAGGSPDTTLASQLLGFVTEDGQGRYGVEQVGQEMLAGANGATADLELDALPLPPTGGTIRLTIDASLQLRLEKELYAAWVANRSPRVSGIVMDPYTGAILAWASVPGYDANNYPDAADRDPGLFTDPLISQVYEPGSVMKMFTAATALEHRVVTLDTPILDEHVLRIGPNNVHNGDRRGDGLEPFQDIIARSRNVGTGKVALMLGKTVDAGAELLYDMWTRLGIGRPTGIELAGESDGIVTDPAETKWQPIDLVNRAFGQGVAVTPLQLATGFSAMVNGGTLPVPHVVDALGENASDPPEPRQVIDEQLSSQLRRLMIHVVEAGPGYAAQTAIPGYTVGGKTGTAQIWDSRRGQWLEATYNHTFVGFVGAERPEAVILVRIHETELRSWRMKLAMSSNELFRRVAVDTIEALDIAPIGSVPGEVPPSTAPDGTPVPAAQPSLEPTPEPPVQLTPEPGAGSPTPPHESSPSLSSPQPSSAPSATAPPTGRPRAVSAAGRV